MGDTGVNMTKVGRAGIQMALILTMAIAATSIGAVTLGQSPGDDGPSPPALADDEVLGFLPYWELGRAGDIDLGVLTTLAWFGVEAGRDGRLVRETVDGEPVPGWEGWTSETFAQLRERARVADVRVILTVERFSWDKAGKRTTKALLTDPDARAALVQDIVDVVTAGQADGVNLDFEPLPRQSRGDFVRLVRGLRRGLDTVDPTLQLTFDLTPDVESFPLRRLVADGAADAAVLMGYEYRTLGSRVAGSVAPLRDPDGLDVRESVARALTKAPADKVILAMPWYGRAWSTRSDQPGSRTRSGDRFLDPATALYRVSLPRAATAGRNWDAQQGSAWSAYRSRACETCPVSWRQLWYDDADSVLAKAGLARRKGLRGVGIWALGYDGDRPELRSALRYGLERRPDRSAPTGTARVEAGSVITEHDGRVVVGPRASLALEATDGPEGSGVAFVRVSTRSKLTDSGALRHGTTFPAGESVTVALPGAEPIDDVFAPGGGPEPDPSLAPTAAPEPPAASALEPLAIHVQWRDIAGNWSEPLVLRVLLDAASSDR